MARIELRNATIRLVDGHTHDPGAVNNGAGYSAGDTTMAVDGIADDIDDLVSFTVAGSNRIHVITSTSGSPTTSITFTPALSGTVADDAVITFRGRALSVKLGDGTLTYTENKEFDYILDKGVLDTVRQGDDQPMDISLDFVWEFITASSGGTPTVEDVLKKTGEASGWASSASDSCEPYAVDIEIEHVPPCSGEQREIITLPDFRYESLEHDPSEATISISGRCNATQATVVRSAA